MLWKLLLLQGAPLLKTGLVQAFLFPKGLKPACPPGGRSAAPSDIHVLIPRTCGYVS